MARTGADSLRLLWVKGGKLLPVDTGGKLRSYHLARELSKRHSLTMLSYYRGRKDAEYESALSGEFPGAVFVRHGLPGEGRLVDVLDYAAHLFSPAPYAVTKFTSASVKRLLRQWYREDRFDAVVCDFLSASLNFDPPLSTPTLLFQHNVESALWKRQAEHERNSVVRLIFAMEAAKMERYEPTALRRFHQVIAVSQHDRQLMSQSLDPSRITVVPTGVDGSRFRVARTSTPKQNEVLFLGSMDWEANIDGAEWFCEKVWPLVRRAVPTAQLQLVGRNPHARVRQLASDHVCVTGTVPSVVEHLASASAVVVPLRIGGGTRLKIYESMAAGRPVISTTVGAEGLEYTAGKDILIADTPESFASAVIDVLGNDELARRLGAAAGALADRHDWSQVVEHFEGAIATVLRDAEPERSRRR
ncbi:MAG: glycosyltransferase [Gemmatimonadaceae bacterium]